jgi:predicted enzyme related to lactoylglutathione lyase
VDDADASLTRVAAGGKAVDGPFEESQVGKIAINQDAVGANLRLERSASRHGGEVFNMPGAMIWNQLNTKEPARAAAFYEKVLGVEVETMTGASPHTLLEVDGRAVAGILKATPEMGAFPPSSMTVKDDGRRRGRHLLEVCALAHPPGHAQVDFGEALALINGEAAKLHLLMMDLPPNKAVIGMAVS